MIRPFALALALALLAAVVGRAQTAPSDASLRTLLEVTETRKVVDTMMTQMDVVMRNTMAQMTKNLPTTLELNAIIDRMQTKMLAVMKEELAWERLEPVYVEVYRQHFTQEEIDGMIAFYRTPVGQAVIRKLPAVMQQSMTAVQSRIGPMLKKAEGIQQEAMREVQELAARRN